MAAPPAGAVARFRALWPPSVGLRLFRPPAYAGPGLRSGRRAGPVRRRPFPPAFAALRGVARRGPAPRFRALSGSRRGARSVWPPVSASRPAFVPSAGVVRFGRPAFPRGPRGAPPWAPFGPGVVPPLRPASSLAGAHLRGPLRGRAFLRPAPPLSGVFVRRVSFCCPSRGGRHYIRRPCRRQRHSEPPCRRPLTPAAGRICGRQAARRKLLTRGVRRDIIRA